MLCHCKEPAFYFLKSTVEDGKFVKKNIYTCDRSSEDNKKKKRCDFYKEETILVTEIKQEAKVNKFYLEPAIKPRNLLLELEDSVSRIQLAQKNNTQYDRYTNKILLLSYHLNIPPYIPEKETIEEFIEKAKYYIHNPIRKPPPKKTNLPIILVEGFDDLLKINPKVKVKSTKKLIKKNNKLTTIGLGKLITGGTVDDKENTEFELDFEPDDMSDVENEDYEYNSE